MSPADANRDVERVGQLLETYARATNVDAPVGLVARLLAAITRESAEGAASPVPRRLGNLAVAVRQFFGPRRIRAIALAFALLALIGVGLVLAGGGPIPLPWVAPRTFPAPTNVAHPAPTATTLPNVDGEPSGEVGDSDEAEDGDAVDDDDRPTPAASHEREDEPSPTDDAHDDDGSGGDSVDDARGDD